MSFSYAIRLTFRDPRQRAVQARELGALCSLHIYYYYILSLILQCVDLICALGILPIFLDQLTNTKPSPFCCIPSYPFLYRNRYYTTVKTTDTIVTSNSELVYDSNLGFVCDNAIPVYSPLSMAPWGGSTVGPSYENHQYICKSSSFSVDSSL